MKLLLDTSCWLWWFINPEKLNDDAKKLINNEKNQLFLSAASIWEIGIKVGTGKLTLPSPPSEYIPSRMNLMGISCLDIKGIHAISASALPLHHKDPFDRMIIAQSQIEKYPILTSDLTFKKYDAKIIWIDN